MKVFLTGATGYIGGAVAQALSHAGHTVYALAHHARAAAELGARGYVPRPGDLRDTRALSDHAGAADAVIHAARVRADDADQVDRAAVEAMVEALQGTRRPFVYTSGVWILGNGGEEAATEDSMPDPTPLVAWRAPLERWLRESGEGLGVRTVILRPGVVYGDGGGIPGMLARGELPLIGDGAQRWPLVHRSDLAALYLAALERAPAGAILHGVAGHATAAEVGGALSEGNDPVRVSLAAARADLGSLADALALDQYVSSRMTREISGWTPRRPLPSASTGPTAGVGS